MTPTDELKKLYRFAIHVIFAAVIAVSFDIAKDVVVPIENIVLFPINFAILILSYFIIVTSWIGYFMSIINAPHEGIIGSMRFTLDIFIIFIFYYMVSLTTPANSPFIPDVFLYVLPTLYVTYWVWDTLKIKEYREKDSAAKKLQRLDARNITLYAMIVILIMCGVYVISLYVTSFETTSLGAHVRDSVFVVFSFMLTLIYRIAKWRHVTKYHEKSEEKSSTKM